MKKFISLLCVLAMAMVVVSCTDAEAHKARKKGNESEFVVTFDAGEGIVIEPIKVKKGEKITEQENPVKKSTATEEYEFDGWYLDEKLWNFETDVVSQDITLTAKWKTKTYTKDLPIRR